jgi:hypothetical protein
MSFFWSEQQYLCSELVQVQPPDKSFSAMANLEEIHRSGATILSESALPAGLELEIVCGGGFLDGVVRECNRNEIGYLVSIDFSASCRWSPDMFRPAHMFDPRELIRLKAEERKAG